MVILGPHDPRESRIWGSRDSGSSQKHDFSWPSILTKMEKTEKTRKNDIFWTAKSEKITFEQKKSTFFTFLTFTNFSPLSNLLKKCSIFTRFDNFQNFSKKTPFFDRLITRNEKTEIYKNKIFQNLKNITLWLFTFSKLKKQISKLFRNGFVKNIAK